MRYFFDKLEEWAFDDSTFLALGKCVFLLLLVCAAIIAPIEYWESQQPKISLNKSEWTCTHSHTVLYPMMIGRVMTMMPEDVCDQYGMNR